MAEPAFKRLHISVSGSNRSYSRRMGCHDECIVSVIAALLFDRTMIITTLVSVMFVLYNKPVAEATTL
jgi:hypothetical protein